MSRLFNDAASEGAVYAGAVVTPYPVTMACWFNSDDLTISQDLMVISTASSTNNYHVMALRGDVANDPLRYQTKITGTTQNADTSVGYSANTWQHACAIGTSATDRKIYLNGGSSGSNTNSMTPSGMNRTGIGVFPDSTAYMSGSIAEAGIWNVALTTAELALLALGISPLLVRPDSLVSYWPLIGYSSPELDFMGPAALTLTGTVAGAHPRVIYPSHSKLFLPAAAVAATVQQQLTLLGVGA